MPGYTKILTVIDLDLVYSQITPVPKDIKPPKKTILGIETNLHSLRLNTLLRDKGICCQCGVKGTYFVLESTQKNGLNPHINLYGINKNGKEVMLTCDHIIPKARGGLDVLENTRCLCAPCNEAKADVFYL